MEAAAKARRSTSLQSIHEVYNCENRTHHPPGFRQTRSAANVLPLALNGMLRTTTETGDIGRYSIKPLQTNLNLDIPKKTARGIGDKHTHSSVTSPLHYTIDDRRYLPSYTKDASFGLRSAFDNISLKSGSTNTLQDKGLRSQSFTQTTCSSIALTNHRSHTSLRSLPEPIFVQRPRSPFPYPTRLKRPGFHSSSPLLVGDGNVDYSKRAEIDRNLTNIMGADVPIQTVPNISMPALGRVSPPICHQAILTGSAGNHGTLRTWTEINEPSQASVSSCRNASELTSTAYCYRHGFKPLIGTKGIVPSSLPIYYDYTEEFADGNGAGSCNRSLTEPVSFVIDNTIIKDPDLRPSVVHLEQDKEDLSELCKISSHTALNSVGIQRPDLTFPIKPLLPSVADHNISLIARSSHRKHTADKGVIANENFFPYDSLLQVSRANSQQPEHCSHMMGSPDPLGTHQEFRECPLLETSELDIHDNEVLFSPSVHLSAFPAPPTSQICGLESNSPATSSLQGALCSLKNHDICRKCIESERLSSTRLVDHFSRERLSPGKANTSSLRPDSVTKQAFSSQAEYMQSNRSFSVGGHLLNSSQSTTELERRERSISENKSAQKSPDCIAVPVPTTKISNTSLGTSHIYCKGPTNCQQEVSRKDVPVQDILPKQHPLKYSVSSASGRAYVASKEGNTLSGNEHRYGCNGFSKEAAQILRITPSQSSSTIIAPKPISPARELKLKNSIPQLMKALPPLPKHASFDVSLSQCQISPNMLPKDNLSQIKIQSAQSIAENFELGLNETFATRIAKETKCPETNFYTHSDHAETMKVDPRLPVESLPLQLSVIGRTNNMSARINDIPVDFYSNLHGPKEAPCDRPRFKLKLQKPSISVPETIRVHKQKASGHLLDGLFNSQPQDLFSEELALASIFRKPSYHMKTVTIGEQDHTRNGVAKLHNSVLRTATPKESAHQGVAIAQFPSHSGAPSKLAETINASEEVSVNRVFREGLQERMFKSCSRFLIPNNKSCNDKVRNDGLRIAGLRAAPKVENLPNVQGNYKTSRIFKGKRDPKLTISQWMKNTKNAVQSHFSLSFYRGNANN